MIRFSPKEIKNANIKFFSNIYNYEFIPIKHLGSGKDSEVYLFQINVTNSSGTRNLFLVGKFFCGKFFYYESKIKKEIYKGFLFLDLFSKSKDIPFLDYFRIINPENFKGKLQVEYKGVRINLNHVLFMQNLGDIREVSKVVSLNENMFLSPSLKDNSKLYEILEEVINQLAILYYKFKLTSKYIDLWAVLLDKESNIITIDGNLALIPIDFVSLTDAQVKKFKVNEYYKKAFDIFLIHYNSFPEIREYCYDLLDKKF